MELSSRLQRFPHHPKLKNMSFRRETLIRFKILCENLILDALLEPRTSWYMSNSFSENALNVKESSQKKKLSNLTQDQNYFEKIVPLGDYEP